MPATRILLGEEVTYEDAKTREINILHQLTYPDRFQRFYDFIFRHQSLIQERVAHHLDLHSPSRCRVASQEEWVNGAFNLCVPVIVDDSKRVLTRFPFPYRIGEDSFCSGNCDEKIRCEAATYAWMYRQCPKVPILYLYGFGLATGQCVCDQCLRSDILCLPRFDSSPKLNVAPSSFVSSTTQDVTCYPGSVDLYLRILPHITADAGRA